MISVEQDEVHGRAGEHDRGTDHRHDAATRPLSLVVRHRLLILMASYRQWIFSSPSTLVLLLLPPSNSTPTSTPCIPRCSHRLPSSSQNSLLYLPQNASLLHLVHVCTAFLPTLHHFERHSYLPYIPSTSLPPHLSCLFTPAIYVSFMRSQPRPPLIFHS